MKNTPRNTTNKREWTLGRRKRQTSRRPEEQRPGLQGQALETKKQGREEPQGQALGSEDSIFVRKGLTVTKIKKRYTLKKRLELIKKKITSIKLPKVKKFSYYRANWGVKQKPVAWVLAGVAIFASFGLFLAQGPSGNVLSASTTDTLYVNGDNTVTGWGNTTGYTSGGTDLSCLGGTYCDYVDENSNTEYLGTGTDGADLDEIEFDFPDVTEAATLEQVTAVTANVRAQTITTNNTADTLSLRLFIDGAYNGTTNTVNPNGTAQVLSATWSGLSATTASDIRIEIVRNSLGSGGPPTGHDDDIRVFQVYADVTYDFTAPPAELTLEGYAFENTDGRDNPVFNVSNLAGTAVNTPLSTNDDWTNLTNISADDSSYVTSTITGSNDDDFTDFLDVSNFGFNIPSGATIVGIEATIDRRSTFGDGITVSDSVIELIGVTGSENKSTGASWQEGVTFPVTFGSSTDLWTTSATPSDVNGSGFGLRIQASSDATLIDGNTVADVDYVEMTIYYQTGLTGDPDGSTTVAGSEFATGKTLTQVRQGETINLRAHLSNNGGPVLDSTEFGLFYDKNDGIWSKVQNQTPPVTGNGTGCASSDWTCKTIDDSLSSPIETSVAISPDGQPWVAYDSEPGDNLKVARFVGSGGNGCSGSTTSGEWSCEVVDLSSGTDTGDFAEIAFAPDGSAWIAYNYGSAVLRVAHFVGSGGNCDSLFGGSDAWDCWTVHDTAGVNYYKGITFDATGNPIIAYYDGTSTSLRLTTYVGGAAGSGCDSTDWDGCSVIDDDPSPTDLDLVTDGNGKLWIAYSQNASANLKVAEYVGSGGSGCAIGVTDWHCYHIHNNGNPGSYAVRMDVAPDGKPSIAYFEAVGNDLWYANFVGTGNTGGCDTTAGGTGDDADLWDCTQVISTDDVGRYPDLAFDPAGNPWISYHDFTTGNLDLEYARFVGGGNGSGCASSDWSCEVIDSADDVGGLTGIAFKPDGNPIISYRDDTNSALKFATIERSGEIRISVSQSGAGGDALSESHADMTSSTDTTNRDDADCLNATTWNNGTYFEAENGTGVSVADGTTTSQCTELMWTIDTSQATPGTTYRFVVATKDSFNSDTGAWRGPVSVATDGYPTLTIAPAEQSTYRYSKDAMYIPNGQGSPGNTIYTNASTFADDTSIGFFGWTNATNASSSDNSYATAVNGSIGRVNSYYLKASNFGLSIPAGAEIEGIQVRIEKSDTVDGGVCGDDTYDNAVRIVKGGTPVGTNKAKGNCADDWTTTDSYSTYGGSTDLWGTTWTAADINSSNFGIAISASVRANTTANIDHIELRVYYTEGACSTTDTAWSCELIHSMGLVGDVQTSMAFDDAGDPWIAFYNASDTQLMVAEYVGSSGSGCTGGSASWSCEIVDNTGSAGENPSIAFDDNGNPWVSYSNGSSGLKVATRGGGYGSACTDADWTCGTVQTTNIGGPGTSLAFDEAGNPWIAFESSDVNGTHLSIATYVGSGGDCDDTAWNCTQFIELANSGSSALEPSLTFDSNGVPWVSYSDRGDGTCSTAGECSLQVARYVGSGGTCTNTSWECEEVDNAGSGNTGRYSSIGVDASNNIWVAYFNSSTEAVKVATRGGGYGSACTDADWTCADVAVHAGSVTEQVGYYNSIAMDPTGAPWVTYHDNTDGDLWFARYVSSGGNCDDLYTGSDAWDCTLLDADSGSTEDVGEFTSLAFDQSGVPWVSYFDLTERDVYVAKLNLPATRLSSQVGGEFIPSGDLRYKLSSGVAPYGNYGTSCGGVTDYLGYCGLYDNDGQYDSLVAQPNERPMYGFATRLADNTKLPTATLDFLTDTSPSTNNVVLQAYRFGTTNAWETVATYNTAGCSTDNCRIQTVPSGTPSEYYEADGSEYWIYFRAYQEESTSAPITLKVDNFSAEYPSSFLRNGRSFRELRSDPLGW